jgi:hypothetical protein
MKLKLTDIPLFEVVLVNGSIHKTRPCAGIDEILGDAE